MTCWLSSQYYNPRETLSQGKMVGLIGQDALSSWDKTNQLQTLKDTSGVNLDCK